MKQIRNMTLKEAVACYQVWNDAELQERLRHAGEKTLEQKWREYLDLMEFGMQIKPSPSVHEQRQKVEMLNHYYEQIQLFEARRKERGKSSEKSVA